jgi:hypothetical protein
MGARGEGGARQASPWLTRPVHAWRPGMFVNTNPVLLYTTIGVSLLHLLFDVLAFKNDLSFWSAIDTMEGLSTRTLLLNFIMEVVILLYLREQVAAHRMRMRTERVPPLRAASHASPPRLVGTPSTPPRARRTRRGSCRSPPSSRWS